MLNWKNIYPRIRRNGRIRCEEGWRLDASFSNRLHDFDLWLVWAGRGTMVVDSQPIDLAPGVCLWMRPGGKYLATQDLENRLGVTFVHFDLATHGGRQIRSGVPKEMHEIWDLHYFDVTLNRIIQYAQQPAPFGTIAETMLKGLLMDLDARSAGEENSNFSGTKLHHRRIMMELAMGIRESPGDANCVKALAQKVGYSPDHFTRVFKQVMGVSPEAFLIQARIERAKQLLSESTLAVSEIADALGYRDLFFFSRQFKAYTSRSPSQYRNRVMAILNDK